MAGIDDQPASLGRTASSSVENTTRWHAGWLDAPRISRAVSSPCAVSRNATLRHSMRVASATMSSAAGILNNSPQTTRELAHYLVETFLRGIARDDDR